jgi:putative endonuclease
MIYCSDASIYTGITTDIGRRWREHHTGNKGARFFRGRSPVALIHLEQAAGRSAASQREYVIKQLCKKQKTALATAHQLSTRALIYATAPEMLAHHHIRSSGISYPA